MIVDYSYSSLYCHSPSEIILICSFDVQEAVVVIIIDE